MSEERKQRILDAINTELKAQGGVVNPLGLATAIDEALGADTLEANTVATPPESLGPGSSPKGVYARVDEGKTPAELNASNDDGRG
ncbi:MAG TPA: hypothetical protein VHB23_09745 [Devosiaceae bacterium]|nr:hypothetical protein [Devosiaceae bacterium]